MLAGTEVLAEGNEQTGTKAMPYQAKPMPFDPKSVGGISEECSSATTRANCVGAVKRP